jgi:hypothetical protein
MVRGVTRQLVRYGDTAPAGPKDACFWCRRTVGETHWPHCVRIVVDVTYELRLEGRVIGKWTTVEPAHWESRDGAFHKNDSSWCCSNVLHDGPDVLQVSTEDRTVLEARNASSCLCDVLEFAEVSRGSEARLRSD